MGADIIILDNVNNTALHLAASSVSVYIMTLLVDKVISVNLTNTNDSLPLNFSAKFGDLEATKFVVERSAAINSTNIYVSTPLSLAECCAVLEIFHYLTEISVHSNNCGDCKNTALHLAAEREIVNIIK